MKTKILSILLLFIIIFLSGCSDEPDEKQIKKDLIGKKIESQFGEFEFGSLSEFEKFEIKGKFQDNNLLEFRIFVILKPASGPKARAFLTVLYLKEMSKWIFRGVTSNNSLSPLEP